MVTSYYLLFYTLFDYSNICITYQIKAGEIVGTTAAWKEIALVRKAVAQTLADAKEAKEKAKIKCSKELAEIELKKKQLDIVGGALFILRVLVILIITSFTFWGSTFIL